MRACGFVLLVESWNCSQPWLKIKIKYRYDFKRCCCCCKGVKAKLTSRLLFRPLRCCYCKGTKATVDFDVVVFVVIVKAPKQNWHLGCCCCCSWCCKAELLYRRYCFKKSVSIKNIEKKLIVVFAVVGLNIAHKVKLSFCVDVTLLTNQSNQLKHFWKGILF